MLTVGSLFAGIGGFDLGLERAGMRIAWHAEIDPYASAVLAKHWPGVPNHGDVRSIRRGSVEPVDVICGGFPCQDVSIAGSGRGLDGERSGLWTEFARIVGDLRPRFALVENVGALTSRGLAAILGDFAALGYVGEWHVIPACAIDAPHIRERCWIIAHAPDADGGRLESERLAQHGDEQGAPRRELDGLGARRRGYGATLSDAEGERIQGDRPAREQIAFAPSLARLLGRDDAGSYWRDWPTVSPLRGKHDGASGRMDRHRLRCLGNAVVPQIAEVIGTAIIESTRP
jgi:DNA (cytosine-5)-methyltransferase 1